jgi:hypothetical protein
MAEQLIIPETTDKKEKYEALLPQLRSLVEDENDLIANLANIPAALRPRLEQHPVRNWVASQVEMTPSQRKVPRKSHWLPQGSRMVLPDDVAAYSFIRFSGISGYAVK